MLDRVIALNEQHLRRLTRNYVSDYHQDRIHDSLEKDTPHRHLKRWAAVFAEGGDPEDTVAGIYPNRFRGCLPKSVLAVCPLRPRGAEPLASSLLRNVTPRCGSDSGYAQGVAAESAFPISIRAESLRNSRNNVTNRSLTGL